MQPYKTENKSEKAFELVMNEQFTFGDGTQKLACPPNDFSGLFKPPGKPPKGLAVAKRGSVGSFR